MFKKYFKNFKFIQLIKENSGQAVTCYTVNHIPSDYSVTFGSSIMIISSIKENLEI